MLKNSFYKTIKPLVWALIISNLVVIKVLAEEEPQIDLTNFQVQHLRANLIKVVNQLREDKNELALLPSEELNSAAQKHAMAMVEYDFFSHTSPLKGLRNLNDRLAKEGIKNVYAAENLSLEFAIELNTNQPFYARLDPNDAKPVFSLDHNGQAIPMRSYKALAMQTSQSWSASKKHRLNILKGVYDSVGVGAELTRNAQQVPIVKIVMVFAALSI